MTRAPRLARLAISTLAVGTLVAPALVLAPAGAAPSPHGSCADVAADDPGSPDGEYDITVHGRTLSVWCADMATTPSEYLTLQRTGPGENLSQATSNSGRTETTYTRLGLDLPTSAADPFSFRPDDARFSTSTGVSPGPVRYAHAGGCNWAPSTFNVDLRGTPFALDRSTIVYVGWLPGGDLVSSPDDKVHTVTNGRGDCGGMLVDAPFALVWTEAVLPVVSTAPASTSVTSGDDAVFAASSTGGPGTDVVWQTSPDGTTWTTVPGAATSTLTLTDVTRSMDGLRVRAVYSNVEGTATTEVATLAVAATAPSLTDPADATVTSGDDATFAVVVSGDPAPALQWELSEDGGTTWDDVDGATDPTLTLSAVTTEHDGRLVRARATNEADTATSAAAELTVQALAPTVSTPDDLLVAAGSDAAASVTVTGDPAPTVRWELSPDGTIWLDTGFEGTDVVLPEVPYDLDGWFVRAVAESSAGTAVSPAAGLTVTAAAPVVVSAPEALTVREGGDATFSVDATGDPEPLVQWQTSTDGQAWTDVEGETDWSLTLADVTADDDGLLVRALLDNVGGSVATEGAVLSVLSVLSPAPVTGAPVLTPTAPTAVPVAAPVAAPAAAQAARAVPSRLARTGADTVDLALVAGLLVAAGGVVTAASRRRSATR